MNSNPAGSNLPRQAISLPDSAWKAIVDTLNTDGPERLIQAPPTNRRVHERKRYTSIAKCILRLQQDDSPPATYMVYTRNLSVGGAGFFFNTYLHPGTMCHLALLTRSKEGQIVGGTIRWCRHVAKNIHEVGMQFDHPIDLDRFVDLGSAESD